LELFLIYDALDVYKNVPELNGSQRHLRISVTHPLNESLEIEPAVALIRSEYEVRIDLEDQGQAANHGQVELVIWRFPC
jgi:hypothetical protein